MNTIILFICISFNGAIGHGVFFIGYLDYISLTDRMTANDWKWCGKKWSWPNLKNYPGIFLEGMRTMKTSVRIAGVLVKIRIGCFPNTNQKHFCLSHLHWDYRKKFHDHSCPHSSSCYTSSPSTLHYIPISHPSNKCFGLDDVGQRGLERDTQFGREWEGSSVIIPTLHGTCLCGLSIAE